MKKIICAFVLAFLFAGVSPSQIRLPKIIGHQMVLQQGKEVNIWGYANPMEKVSVRFDGKTQKTVADEKGCWNVQLPVLNASAKPATMTITAGKYKTVLNDILVGEVWLASGQSNMEYRMLPPAKYQRPYKGEDIQQQELDKASCPMMRVLYVERNLKTDTLPSVGWQKVDKTSLPPIAAAAYFFGKNLIDSLNVPVGIISTSWGGTAIEVWTPEQAYLESEFKDEIINHTLHNNTIGDRFEHMMFEMAPYTMRGFIWYQGESNLTDSDSPEAIYTAKQRIMVESWRKTWNDPTLSFYYVQISPYLYSQRRDLHPRTWDALPKFWEAQTMCMLEDERTGMVVTTDLVDDLKDIHPSYKWIVGERLARWALVKDYGRKELTCLGPTFRSMEIKEGKVVLSFDHVDGGLLTNDGKAPTCFQLIGANGRFENASAEIVGDKIVLTPKAIKDPKYVRFAWDEAARPNLINAAGLPALPFRSNGKIDWSRFADIK